MALLCQSNFAHNYHTQVHCFIHGFAFRCQEMKRLYKIQIFRSPFLHLCHTPPLPYQTNWTLQQSLNNHWFWLKMVLGVHQECRYEGFGSIVFLLPWWYDSAPMHVLIGPEYRTPKWHLLIWMTIAHWAHNPIKVSCFLVCVCVGWPTAHVH